MSRTATLLVAFALSGCIATAARDEIELHAGVSTVPGVGGAVGIAQHVATVAGTRLDAELELVHQELDTAPDGGDDLDQVRLGLLASYPAGAADRFTARLGATWLRIQGDAVYVDGTGDFGGGYVALGYRWRLTERLSFAPDLAFAVVDAEGAGDFGGLLELTWRLVWHL